MSRKSQLDLWTGKTVGATQQKEYRERMRKRGYKLLQIWTPAPCVEQLKEYAASVARSYEAGEKCSDPSGAAQER